MHTHNHSAPNKCIDPLTPDDRQFIAGLLGIHDGGRFSDMTLRIARRDARLIGALQEAAARKLVGAQRHSLLAELASLSSVEAQSELKPNPPDECVAIRVEPQLGPLAVNVSLFAEQVAEGVVNRSERHVLIDPGLNRLSIARREMPEIRLWNYGHRASDGSGRISKVDLFDYLQRHGIVTNKRTFDNILAGGAGLYWKIREGQDSTGAPVLIVYLTGWRKLAKRLVKLCLKHEPTLLDSILPGMGRVWVDLSGSLQEAAARCYGAWMAIRAVRSGHLDISRAVLQMLWKRNRKTLLEWEAIIEAEKQARYAEHNELTSPLIPGHADLCLEVGGQEFATWRSTNRYLPKSVNQHRPNGQRRKVRAAVNAIINPSEPADLRDGGQRRVKRPGRIYFADRQRAQRSGDGGKAVLVTVPGIKSLNAHLKQHGDIFDRRHYVEVGTRYGVHIVEYSIGGQHRSLHRYRDFLAESFPEFVERAAQYRAGWAAQ